MNSSGGTAALQHEGPPPMSRFHITDEAIAALWNGLAFDLQELAPSPDAAKRFLKLARHDFLRMLANFPEDVLAGVTYTAPGTGKQVFGIVLSDRFHGDMTLAAKSFYRSRSH